MAIALERSEARLVIEPSIGGTIARYAWRGREVLRPALAPSPVEMSCFPLVPFANRIAYGRFRWQGRTIALHPNFGDDPHAIHGQGWQTAWSVIAQEDARATLAFRHEAGEWPWAYRAELGFSLGDDGLHAALALTNHGNDPMPASLGFHPYFPRSARSKLTATVEGTWLTGKTLIPTMLVPPLVDFAKGAVLDDIPPLDHCFTGWPGKALIEQPDEGLRVHLEADTRFLHVFVPEGADYFCAEPVTAMPDAVNRSEQPRETGLLALAPGATFTMSMTIKPEEAAS